MKTTKLFLIIALVALTTTSFSQLSFQDRLFSKRNHEVVYYTADYIAEANKIESWMVDLHDWANSKVSRDAYQAPVVSRTYVIDQVEIIYEDELYMESWMSAPFECDVYEADLLLESWMTVPFETGLEEEISIETWMTAPFDAAEEIEIEDWMTTAFI